MLRPGSAFLVLQFLVPQLSAGCLHASGQGQLEEMGTVQACSWMKLGCCFGVLCYGRRPAVASNCPRCSSSLLAAHQPRPPALLHCRRSSRRRALARVTSWSRHGSSTLARRRVRWGRCNSSRGRRRQTVNEKCCNAIHWIPLTMQCSIVSAVGWSCNSMLPVPAQHASTARVVTTISSRAPVSTVSHQSLGKGPAVG